MFVSLLERRQESFIEPICEIGMNGREWASEREEERAARIFPSVSAIQMGEYPFSSQVLIELGLAA